MKYIDADKLYEYLEQVSGLYPRYADNIVDNAVGNVIGGIKTFITSLQQEQPSLPSNLDEAAIDAAQLDMQDRQIIEDSNEHRMLYSRIFRRGFKAGAEWMAGQGVSMQGKVGIYGVDVESITKELREVGFKIGEEVTLQIRKKQ